MNFLGHLYFSNDDVQLQYANLFGDFVKGSDLSAYPIHIQKGIVLHRTIDSYIDHHEAVIDLLHNLYDELPKIAGIAVDLYFDHLLAIHWNRYHGMDLPDFVQRFYTADVENKPSFFEEFKHLIKVMKAHDWLNSYSSFSGLENACNGLSRRISFPNMLANAPDVFIQKESHIEQAFEAYMADAIPFFKNYFANNP